MNKKTKRKPNNNNKKQSRRLICHDYRHHIPAFPPCTQPKLSNGEVHFRWEGEGRSRTTKNVFKWPRYPIGPLCSSSNKALDDKDIFQCGRC